VAGEIDLAKRAGADQTAEVIVPYCTEGGGRELGEEGGIRVCELEISSAPDGGDIDGSEVPTFALCC
jgi:hypothetical protein